MKSKFTFVLTIIILFSYFVKGEQVDKSSLEKIAKNYISNIVVNNKLTKYTTVFIKDIKELYADNIVVAYVVELSPEVYIIFSSDRKIKPIIGYSFEDDSENILLHLVQQDLKGRIRFFDSDEAEALQFLQTNEIYRPILTTSWNQRGHYNAFCPLDPITNQQTDGGYVATATSQILNRWKYHKQFNSIKIILGNK